MFGMYFGYCWLMKHHEKVYQLVMKARFGDGWTLKEDLFANSRFVNPSTFRAGIIHLLTTNRSMLETAGIQIVVKLKGDLEQTFMECDTDRDGKLVFSECKAMLINLNESDAVDDDTVRSFMLQMNTYDASGEKTRLNMIGRKRMNSIGQMLSRTSLLSSQSLQDVNVATDARSNPQLILPLDSDEEKSPSSDPNVDENVTLDVNINKDSVPKRLDGSEVDRVVTFNQFKNWYIASEKRLKDDMDRAWNEFDKEKKWSNQQ